MRLGMFLNPPAGQEKLSLTASSWKLRNNFATLAPGLSSPLAHGARAGGLAASEFGGAPVHGRVPVRQGWGQLCVTLVLPVLPSRWT